MSMVKLILFLGIWDVKGKKWLRKWKKKIPEASALGLPHTGYGPDYQELFGIADKVLLQALKGA